MSSLLDTAPRGVLAWLAADGPRVAPMAYWWDGRSAWMSTASTAAKVAALEANTRCALLVTSSQDSSENDSRAGVGQAEAPGQAILVKGRARVFRPDDLRLAVTHGGVVAAAATALAVKQAPSLLGYVADAPKIPARWRPNARVMLRVRSATRRTFDLPEMGPGIAPALPPAVPADIRRLLSGQRRVALAAQMPDGSLALLPGVIGAGWAVTLPDRIRLPDSSRVVVTMDHDPRFRPSDVAGVAVRGTWQAGKLEPDVVRWWSGFAGGRADVSGGGPEPIVIPD